MDMSRADLGKNCVSDLINVQNANKLLEDTNPDADRVISKQQVYTLSVV